MKNSIQNHQRKNLWPNLIFSFNKGASIWTILVFLILASYCIWSLDRAFEISDESYYLLLAINSSAVKLFVSAQHWVTSGLWSITGSMVGFRAIGLVILLISAAILARGIIHAYVAVSIIDAFLPMELFVIYASTLTGALLYGASINFSPCYNLLATAASYAAIGFVLISVRGDSVWSVKISTFLVGSALGITMLNKFSAGILVLFLAVIFIFI